MTNMFGGKAPAPAPTPAPPPAMPDPNSPDIMAARRKAVADASRGGRASTVLTSQGGAGQTLAGSSFSGSKLGSAA